MNSDRIKSLANIVASNLSEAANRTKRNPTRDFLRRYPVSDAEMAKPVKTPEKKKEEKQGVAEVAFKDPSPMMKDSIKQDKIRSLKNLIAVAKVKGIHHKVKEYESELKKLKETTEVTEAGAFSYGAKPPRKGSVAYNALMQRKEQDKKRVKEIEAIGTKNHHVGVAKVTKEQIEDVAEIYKYIDQSGGHEIKGKSGTFVGYTHSATKGKGANILKHNQTKKYYAAGGSSTAFTAKTTLHDTPEDAARAYHKGNLAEENLEEGSNSETEGMVSYIHHIIKNHVYPRAGDKEAYMKHVAKHMPTIVKSNPKLFRRAHSIAYDRFFHVDKNDDYDHTDYSMRQGERGMREGLAEENNQLDEISLGNYKEKAQKEVGELKPYAKGEYGDLAKKIIAKRKAGLQRAMRRESVKDDNSIPFDGPYTKVPNKQPQSKKPPGFSRAKHLAQLMKDRMSKIKEQNNLQEETDTAEHHFEKSLEHYHKADKALKDGDREKHDYHVAMGDVHKDKVDQHLSKTDFKHASHIHTMSSHLFKHQQKHREIQRNQAWEDEKNQTIQRGHEYMQRAGERSNFEMKDGKLHRKPPKYDRNTGEKLNNEAYMGKVKLVSNPREKWMKSVKDRGYDMRAGAQRLQDLLDKQKKERAEMEQRAKEKGLEY